MISNYAVTTHTPCQGSFIRRPRLFSSQRIGFGIAFKVQMKGSDSHSYTTVTCSSLKQSFFKDNTSLKRKKHFYPATASSHEITSPSALLSFIYPYAILGFVTVIVCTSLLPVETVADLSPTFFFGLLKAIIPMVLIFIYNLAVNQWFDIELDKVNKPYLPLASGGVSVNIVAAVTILTSCMSIAMGLMIQSTPLLCAILTMFLFGSVYSINLPFLRWKKNGILAIVCIVAWGLGTQVGIFFHIQKYVLGKPMVFTRGAIFATIIHFISMTVLGLIKDFPDVDGDKAHGCENMTIRLGKEKVFWGSTILKLATYGVAVVFGFSSPFVFSKLITVLGHSALVFVFWDRARQVNLSDDESTQSYYMFLWKLSSVEVFLAIFIR